MTETNESSQTWESVSERMPELLATLTSSELLHRNPRGQLPEVPERGIYVFYEGCRPRYVGRSGKVDGNPGMMRRRIQQHSQNKASHNKAALAFRMAERKAAKCGIKRGLRSRSDFQKDKEFKPFFDKAKAEVREMKIRVVEITDAIEQTVFEVFAALKLKTTVQQGGYNDFDNH